VRLRWLCSARTIPPPLRVNSGPVPPHHAKGLGFFVHAVSQSRSPTHHLGLFTRDVMRVSPLQSEAANAVSTRREPLSRTAARAGAEPRSPAFEHCRVGWPISGKASHSSPKLTFLLE
jgi:hypothetical protein